MHAERVPAPKFTSDVHDRLLGARPRRKVRRAEERATRTKPIEVLGEDAYTKSDDCLVLASSCHGASSARKDEHTIVPTLFDASGHRTQSCHVISTDLLYR